MLVISPKDSPFRNPLTHFISNASGLNPEIETEVASCDAFIHLFSPSTPLGFNISAFCRQELFETLSLFEIIGKRGAPLPFIYISSGGAVYGNCQLNRPFTEDDIPKPVSLYGVSKWTIENYLNHFSQIYDSIHPIILRPSNVYGYGTVKLGRNIVHTCFQKIKSSEVLTVWGNGHTKKDYLHLDDFCNLITKIIQNPKLGIYNVASGNLYSIFEIINMVERVTGKKLEVQITAPNLSDVTEFSLNSQRAQNTFNWKASVLFEEGLQAIWNKIR